MTKPSAPRPILHLKALLTVLITIAGTASVEARMSASQSAMPGAFTQQNDIGASAAAAAASAASGGRVLDVKRNTARNGIFYAVKVLLPGGRMRTLIVDGLSGQVRG